MSGAVGLIVNPAAGRDIRRLVAWASVVPHHEKAAVARRLLEGLAAVGVNEVWVLPDGLGIIDSIRSDLPSGLRLEPVTVDLEGRAEDSTRAAAAMCRLGVRVIVTVGGDGTNRAVAAACGDTPLVAVSTGTNNVFPTMVDGTIAGMAAGLVATGAVAPEHVSRRSKRVEVISGVDHDFALVDAAACRQPWLGSRALWNAEQVSAVVLARAEPWAVGLSSIGGRLYPLGPDEPAGLYLELGEGIRVLAVLAPGRVVEVGVADWRVLDLDEDVDLPGAGGTVALDGERELSRVGGSRARVTARGPVVVDVRRAMALAISPDGQRRG